MNHCSFYVILMVALSSLLACQMTTQQVPTLPAYWEEVYNGYGKIIYHQNYGIVMQPAQASIGEETHAALVLIKQTVTHPKKDFTVKLTVTTERQLRLPDPNPWEVFWLVFNYAQDSTSLFSTNYFLVKTNGIELGIAYAGRQQKFLYTKTSPSLKLKQPMHWVVSKKGNTIIASIDGLKVMEFAGNIKDRPGAIGLYTEDARVRVQNVMLK
jgi:hypothetical protein